MNVNHQLTPYQLPPVPQIQTQPYQVPQILHLQTPYQLTPYQLPQSPQQSQPQLPQSQSQQNQLTPYQPSQSPQQIQQIQQFQTQLTPYQAAHSPQQFQQIQQSSQQQIQPSNLDFQSVNLQGVITKVEFTNIKHSTGGTFNVWLRNSQRNVKCRADFKCPLREGDVIDVEGTMDGNGVVYFRSLPFIQQPVDRQVIISCLARALYKKSMTKPNLLYDKLYQETKSEEGVIAALSELSYNWCQHYNKSVLEPYLPCVHKETDLQYMLKFWYQERSLRRLYLYGMDDDEINASRLTHDEVNQCLVTNPYKVLSVELNKCDMILKQQHKTLDPRYRVLGNIGRVLWHNLHRSKWVATTHKSLCKTEPKVGEWQEDLRKEHEISFDVSYQAWYLPYPLKVELFLSQFFAMRRKDDKYGYESEKTPVVFTGQFELSADQEHAITGALSHNLSIITGAAGSGKSSCISEIIHNLRVRKEKYALTSFTGKAVSRINTLAKTRIAATLDRMIHTKGRYSDVEYGEYIKNANSKAAVIKKDANFERDPFSMDFETLVVDEASMVRADLLYEFLMTFNHKYRIIFIGDVNQLPPIGAGFLFEQMINSGTIPTYRLVVNHRQYITEGLVDGVTLNSNAILKHNPCVPYEFVQTTNFSIKAGNASTVVSIIQALYNAGIKIEEIAVICPWNDPLRNLNKEIQRIYCSGSRSVSEGSLGGSSGARSISDGTSTVSGGSRSASDGTSTVSGGSRSANDGEVVWMVGDKVLMTKNDYNVDLYNGSIGKVIDIEPGAILVRFPTLPKPVVFKLRRQYNGNNNYGTKRYGYQGRPADMVADLTEEDDELTTAKLKHAFALSIDAMQGDEAEYVVGYFPPNAQNSGFLNKNRVYTMITRARRCFWLVADRDVASVAAVTRVPWRCENLAKRLQKDLPRIGYAPLPAGLEGASVVDNEPDFGEDDFDPSIYE